MKFRFSNGCEDVFKPNCYTFVYVRNEPYGQPDLFTGYIYRKRGRHMVANALRGFTAEELREMEPAGLEDAARVIWRESYETAYTCEDAKEYAREYAREKYNEVMNYKEAGA